MRGFCIWRGSAFLSDIDFATLAALAARIALLAEESRLTIHALPRIITKEVAQAMEKGSTAPCAACC